LFLTQNRNHQKMYSLPRLLIAIDLDLSHETKKQIQISYDAEGGGLLKPLEYRHMEEGFDLIVI